VCVCVCLILHPTPYTLPLNLGVIGGVLVLAHAPFLKLFVLVDDIFHVFYPLGHLCVCVCVCVCVFCVCVCVNPKPQSLCA